MVQSTQQIGIQGPYVYPCTTATCAWTRATGTARIALANPNSGPGTAVDSSWTGQIARIRSSGMLMLGYIMSTSSGVPKSEVNAKAEISRYLQHCTHGSAQLAEQTGAVGFWNLSRSLSALQHWVAKAC